MVEGSMQEAACQTADMCGSLPGPKMSKGGG
jgi:hypothetical protein